MKAMTAMQDPQHLKSLPGFPPDLLAPNRMSAAAP